ncbi:SIR2 family protein [Ralstonia solanacearum]|uniref:SIR2 family protein n=1 Tax=Ralstonia solanacearum TaxID=305 RepID=UPI00078DD9D6|nr:SIR2 family protein [Ralstonia solanacearum]AMP39258.1 hypothetical protein LBM2029_16650 [Ralstonia solanacearum]
MDGPTGLPSGIALTKALMAHLLEHRANDEIRKTYEACKSIVGRTVPRLEHILDIVCNETAVGDPLLGAPRELLRIFEARQPNALHEAIASHLGQTKSWGITTNFDDCVERASSYSIPVYLVNPETKALEVLHAAGDSGWGLIKVHGTIEQGVDGLGATLADFDGGLPLPMQELLDSVMNGSDLVVVAGYSGSDHFDINRWMAARMNAKRKPKLIWIHHNSEIVDPFNGDETQEPNVTWGSAFGGRWNLCGPTREFLSKLIPAAATQLQAPPITEKSPDLAATLSALYQPTKVQKHLNGARLAAAIGIGQLAEEELRSTRMKPSDQPSLDRLWPTVFEQCGMLHEAAKLSGHFISDIGERYSARARIARRRGKSVRAICIALWAMATKRCTSNEDRIAVFAEFAHALLDLIERWQRIPLADTKVFRRPVSWTVDRLWALCGKEVPIGPQLNGRLQQLGIRRLALLGDLENDLIRFILGAVSDQAVYPDFYMEEGPVMPGFFLTRLSTLRELDRLAELTSANLEFADILSALWVRHRRANRRREAGSQQWIVNSLFYGEVMKLIEDARDIAEALDEPHLRVTVSAALTRIDREIGGLAYVRPQRLYLGGEGI